jgi:hypothetical protein
MAAESLIEWLIPSGAIIGAIGGSIASILGIYEYRKA